MNPEKSSVNWPKIVLFLLLIFVLGFGLCLGTIPTFLLILGLEHLTKQQRKDKSNNKYILAYWASLTLLAINTVCLLLLYLSLIFFPTLLKAPLVKQIFLATGTISFSFCVVYSRERSNFPWKKIWE